MLYHQTYLPLHRWRVQLEDRYFRVSISVTPQLRTALPPGKAISAVQLSRPLPLSPSLSRALLSCYPTLPGQIHWWWIVNSASLLSTGGICRRIEHFSRFLWAATMRWRARGSSLPTTAENTSRGKHQSRRGDCGGMHRHRVGGSGYRAPENHGFQGLKI